MNNPYDNIGWQHNDMLSKFINEVLLKSSQNPERDNEELALELAFEFFNSDETAREYLSNYWDKSNLETPQFDETMSRWMNDNPIIYERYFDIREITNNSEINLETKINEIIRLETEIISSNYSDFDKQVVLQATSIGRWSLYFWAPIDMGGLGNYDLLIANRPQGDAESVVDWWSVGRSDIWGACTAAFGTANPFAALGWGVVSSAISAGDQYFQ